MKRNTDDDSSRYADSSINLILDPTTSYQLIMSDAILQLFDSLLVCPLERSAETARQK
jgi:hypothetical protein